MFQQVKLAAGEQVVVTTPFGSVVVSSQRLSSAEHVYITPPEGFKRVKRTGATDVYERAV